MKTRILTIITLFCIAGLHAMEVTSTEPRAVANAVNPNSLISIRFDSTLSTATVNASTIRISSSYSGTIDGTFEVYDNLVVFTPDEALPAGQRIQVLITDGVENINNNPSIPYVYFFDVAASGSSAVFEQPATLNSAGDNVRHVFPADIDGDGDMDIFMASSMDGEVAWLENNGSASFSRHLISSSESGAFDVHGADIDGDGDIDLITSNESLNEIAWYANNGGSFSSKIVISSAFNFPNMVYASDLDLDGDMDVLAASRGGDSISWFENNGSQQFTHRLISDETLGPRDIRTADVDLDGFMDVIACSRGDRTVTWYRNDGFQNFTEDTIYISNSDNANVYPVDMDHDGDVDFVTTTYNDNEVAWHENNGAGEFVNHIVTTSANGALWAIPADFDNDGDIDIVSASALDDQITLFLNDGNQHFNEKVLTSLADGAFIVFPVDLDGDNDLDILATSRINDEVIWLEQKDPNAGIANQYISDLPWISSTSGLTTSAIRDKNQNDSGLTSLGSYGFGVFTKGVGIQGASSVRVELAGSYASFSTEYGIDIRAFGSNTFAKMKFYIYGDNILLFESSEMSYGESGNVNVNVSGYNELELVTSPTTDTGGEFGFWGNARLTLAAENGALSKNTLDFFAPLGTPVGQILGGVAPYRFVNTGDSQSADNDLFSLLTEKKEGYNTTRLVLNSPLNRRIKDTLYIACQDMNNDTLYLTVEVDRRPSQATKQSDIYYRSEKLRPVDGNTGNNVSIRSYLGGGAMQLYPNGDIILNTRGGAGGSSQQTSLLINRNDGTFERYITGLTNNEPQDYELFDYDNDNNPEIMNARLFGVTSFLNNKKITYYTRHSNTNIDEIEIVDFNGDGRMDVLALNQDNGRIFVLIQDEQGYQNSILLVDESISVYNIFTADIDKDGRPDIIYSGNKQLKIWKNLNGHNFQLVKTITDDIYTFNIGDIDGDDILDLVYSSGSVNPYIKIAHQDASFNFVVADSLDYSGFAQALYIQDLNSDGAPDIFLSNNYWFSDNRHSILWNNNDGTFTNGGQQIEVNNSSGEKIFYDYNQDGIPDIIDYSNYSINESEIYIHFSVINDSIALTDRKIAVAAEKELLQVDLDEQIIYGLENEARFYTLTDPTDTTLFSLNGKFLSLRSGKSPDLDSALQYVVEFSISDGSYSDTASLTIEFSLINNLTGIADSSNVYLQWEYVDSELIDYFEVRSRIEGGTFGSYDTTRLNKITDSGLNEGDTYFYTVIAHLTNGSTSNSLDTIQLTPFSGSGNGFLFTGNNDLVFDQEPEATQSAATYDFWMKTTHLPDGVQSSSILSKCEPVASRYGFNFLLNEEGKLEIRLKDFDMPEVASSSIAYNDDQWHHINLTYKWDETAQTMTLYVDADSIFTVQLNYNIITSDPLRLGRSSDNFWSEFQGQIDNFMIWDKVLSSDEIKYYHTRNVTGFERNLAMWLPFDGPQGATRINDQTPNRLNISDTLQTSPSDIMLESPIIWRNNEWLNGSPSPDDYVVLISSYTGDLSVASLVVNDSLVIEHVVKTGDILSKGVVYVPSGRSLITNGFIYKVPDGEYIIDRQTTFDKHTGRYSIVGSPVMQTPFSVLGENALIYGYDETVPYQPNVNQGIDRYKTPDQLNHSYMEAGRGYFSAFTGDENGLIRFLGTPHYGEVRTAISRTDHSLDNTLEDQHEGFNLIANPYPAAISYEEFIASNSINISNTLWFWSEANTTMGERGNTMDFMVVNELGVAGGGNTTKQWNGNIGTAQGFFVEKTSNGTTDILFLDDMKDTLGNNEDQHFFRKKNAGPYTVKLGIMGEGEYHETIVGFAADATAGFDPRYDGKSLSGSDLQLFTTIDNIRYTIQALPLTDQLQEVDLGLRANEGYYKIFVCDKHIPGNSAWLRDNITGEVMSLQDTVIVHTITTDDPYRFTLLFREQRITDVQNELRLFILEKDDNIQLYLGDYSGRASWELYDHTGLSYGHGTVDIKYGRGEVTLPQNTPKTIILRLKTENDMYNKRFINK